MVVGNYKDLKGVKIKTSEALDTSVKVLISPKDGWDGYVMRVIEVSENGYTPKHSHPWPHINYMIEGEGEMMVDGETTKVTSGSYSYIKSNSIHQFKNIGKGTFIFICIVPDIGHINR